MNYTTLLFVIMMLGAFAIGSAVHEQNINEIIKNIDHQNISQNINIIAPPDSDYLTQGFFKTIDAWLEFATIGFIESLKIGIRFGANNPSYFTPEFIIAILKWIVFAVIVSLLIKPLTYLVILLILFGVWIKESISKRRKHEKST